MPIYSIYIKKLRIGCVGLIILATVFFSTKSESIRTAVFAANNYEIAASNEESRRKKKSNRREKVKRDKKKKKKHRQRQ